MAKSKELANLTQDRKEIFKNAQPNDKKEKKKIQRWTVVLLLNACLGRQ
jgi:hypothetical protein